MKLRNDRTAIQPLFAVVAVGLISPNSNGGIVEWEQEYPGSWNRVTDWVGYHTEKMSVSI